MSKILRYLMLVAFFTICIISITVILINNPAKKNKNNKAVLAKHAIDNKINIPADFWAAPHIKDIPAGADGAMINYGRELIAHTAKYFGPQGTITHLTNKMNCQNCHMDAGTKLFSNNYSGFMADYPKKSRRSGKYTSPTVRIIECFERSLNGKAPDSTQKEMKAILAYMNWVGKDVKKGQKIFGRSTKKLQFMDRPSDPDKGKLVYIKKCKTCHGANGEGILAADKKTYVYPPLWGSDSYSDGAGMYRLISFAGFVKNNMPYGVTYKNTQLTDEEAWDVAAFVNSQPRPHRNQTKDYPDLKQKPIDLPFGPYADKFTEKQHKYGPFKSIQNYYTL